MEMNSFVFQTDSIEVTDCFLTNDNYIIEYNEEKLDDSNYCVIYFSSNDIYYPNNIETFHKNIVEKNKFEWYNIRIKKATKHIFIRDIQKQWYLKGINRNLNSIEKVFEFLENETQGYQIICIGSSAGGFAAVLFGQLLLAQFIYTFNGQFMLHDLLDTTNEEVNPVIFREKNNIEVSKYYSLREYITKPESIYYFLSKKSSWDELQYLHIADKNVHTLTFNTNHHGIPFLKVALPGLLELNEIKLKKYSGKKLNPLVFTIQMAGVCKTIVFVLKLSIGKFFRK